MTREQVVAFVAEDMRDLAADFGTSIALIAEPFIEDGDLVVDGITPEGSLIRSKFSVMHEYAVTGWAERSG
jgi:hypothetical protein